MVGHGSKFELKKEEAIAALLTQRNIEEAARVTGIGTQTLLRWMKKPEFEAAYRKARRAAVSQSHARLHQASSAAVTTLLKIMVDPKARASARVRAADSVFDRAHQAIENEDNEVRSAAQEQAANPTKGKRSWTILELLELHRSGDGAPPAGHGSRFDRKKEEAVAALLTQRSIEEAARVAGIGTQTLMRWMKIPEFEAACREARRAAMSQSNARLQQACSAAVTVLFQIMVDPSAPESARVRAANSLLDRANQAIESEDNEVRFAAQEQAANPKGKRPPGSPQELRELYRSLPIPEAA
jgi:transposase-like protein